MAGRARFTRGLPWAALDHPVRELVSECRAPLKVRIRGFLGEEEGGFLGTPGPDSDPCSTSAGVDRFCPGRERHRLGRVFPPSRHDHLDHPDHPPHSVRPGVARTVARTADTLADWFGSSERQGRVARGTWGASRLVVARVAGPANAPVATRIPASASSAATARWSPTARCNGGK